MPWIAVVLCAPLAVVLLLSGCKTDTTNFDDIDLRGEHALAGSQDHLARAIATLERADQFDQRQAQTKVISQLSQWIESQPPVDAWSVDPMMRTLPGNVKPVFDYSPLERMQFVGGDYFALHEAVWLRQIARSQIARMREMNPDPFFRVEDLQAKLQKLRREEDTAQNKQRQSETTDKLMAAQVDLDLLKAMWLFDWTTRNIRLLPTNWDFYDPDAKTTQNEKPVPPPGAQYSVWQSLLLGQGDAVERARLFLLLCRQANIEVVILGIASEKQQLLPREWVAGAIVGDAVYLFDPELGLALPGPDPLRPATLAQVRKHPELLEALGTEEFPYFVTEEHLERIVPLVDASAVALSQRMMLIEQSLKEEQELVLTASPSAVAKRLRKYDLTDAKIWHVPYRAFLFDVARQRNPELGEAFYQQLNVLNPPMELYTARLHHFRGEIDEPTGDADPLLIDIESSETSSTKTNRYQHGAKHYYLECRNPTSEIESIGQELEAWFAQDKTRSRREMMQMLFSDLGRLSYYKNRRDSLQGGDIDPAEQFYRQQMEAEAMKADPEAAAKMSKSDRELLPVELADMQAIEERLRTLSPTTRDWVQRLPIGRMLAENEAERSDFMSEFHERAAKTKQHATWWLAVVMMEEGNLGVAANYLAQRDDDATDSVWNEYAHHQLGRLYEAAGQREKAIEHYQADQSPQRAGSLVKAKLLAESASNDEATPE